MVVENRLGRPDFFAEHEDGNGSAHRFLEWISRYAGRLVPNKAAAVVYVHCSGRINQQTGQKIPHPVRIEYSKCSHSFIARGDEEMLLATISTG